MGCESKMLMDHNPRLFYHPVYVYCRDLTFNGPTNFHNRLVWRYHLPYHCPCFSLLLLGHAKAVSPVGL